MSNGSPSQPDLDRITVRLVEIGKEAALGVVTPVDFVEEVHTLKAEGVVSAANDIRIVLEALDIDYGDLGLSRVIVDGEVGFDVLVNSSRELM